MKKRNYAQEEKVNVAKIAQDTNIDKQRLAECINVMFVLADIAEGYILEAENILKSVDPYLSLDIRNSIGRIKSHSRNLVSFVDKVSTTQYAESFGDVSDYVKGLVENYLIDRNEKVDVVS